MSHYAIINEAGDVVSLGTVLAASLPDGLTAHEITADDAGALAAGGTWVNGAVVPAQAADPAETVLAAVQTARQEVAGYAPSNGTRQAVEALATAVETLVTPPT